MSHHQTLGVRRAKTFSAEDSKTLAKWLVDAVKVCLHYQKLLLVSSFISVVPNQESTDPQWVREKLAGGPPVHWNLTK